jgi:hypothetical protein
MLSCSAPTVPERLRAATNAGTIAETHYNGRSQEPSGFGEVLRLKPVAGEGSGVLW